MTGDQIAFNFEILIRFELTLKGETLLLFECDDSGVITAVTCVAIAFKNFRREK